MFAVAGASGQLGRLAIADLLARVPAAQIAALVRDPGKVAGMAAQGIAVREADYNRPETLEPALAGIERLLLISGSEVGQRQRQHQAVIDAAAAVGVRFICYTSVLHADRSTIGLAEEHRQTEAAIRASGLSFALLRNGWYSENYTGALAPSLQFGVIAGSSGAGRISAAPRRDYAAAAAAVLAAGDAGAVHELAGDAAFTMAEFAAEVSRQASKTVTYQDMPEAAYAGMLESVGLPAPVAAMIADASFQASKDMLFDDSGTLSRLIGRSTTPIAASIAEALETVGAGPA
jgi:NAD(P)H dehydrogenase (quinone)